MKHAKFAYLSLGLLLVSGCTPAQQTKGRNSAAAMPPIPAVNRASHQVPAQQRPVTTPKSETSKLASPKRQANPTAAPAHRTLGTHPRLSAATVRGIYVTQASLRGPKLKQLKTFVRQHGLNAMVIDVKDDYGHVALDATTKSAVSRLRRDGIYLIARIVAFKDPALARRRPSLAIARQGGGYWTQNGTLWVDPYKLAVWRYNVGVAQSAARAGFDEIQWDYVRFPDASPAKLRSAAFANPNHVSKPNNIAAFLKYARQRLPGVRISADVFGLVTSASDDMGIGQVWEKMSPNLDVISPMMYPSHYGSGIYGLSSPERNPHLTVEQGLKDAIRRNARLRGQGIRIAVIRPWLQDFDMRVPYNRSHVQAQIKAARDMGISGYLLWNQGNHYSN